MAWNAATMAELMIAPTDVSQRSEIKQLHDVSSVDEVIDRARAASREGKPRYVAALVDAIEVARFTGTWIYEGGPDGG